MKMTREQILAWLEAHGGQKGEMRSEAKTIDNPKYSSAAARDPDYAVPAKISVVHRTWTANDGQVLTVMDPSSGDAGTSPPGGIGPTEDVIYQVVEQGPPEVKDDTRTPEQKEQQANQATKSRSENAESMWNLVNGPNPTDEHKRHPAYDGQGRGSGQYETHQERVTREQTQQREDDRIADRARAAKNDEERNAIERDRVELERKRVEQAAKTEARQAEIAAGQLAVQQGQLGLQERETALREKGTSQIVGSPTYADEKISIYNPVTGGFTSADNPNFDAVRKAAEQEKERIRLEIEAGKYNAEVGAQKYKEWYDKNVTVPLAQAAERRAQSTERRQAQEAADRREQAKAENELNRARLGQQAAESAQANVRAQLPYMAGPEFGEQFSSAVNSLAAGGVLGRNASEGINFTASAFEFDAPNWKRIAKQATKDALKHLTPYNPDETPYAVADYTGIQMPDPNVMQGAPTLNLPNITVPTYNPVTPITINSGG